MQTPYSSPLRMAPLRRAWTTLSQDPTNAIGLCLAIVFACLILAPVVSILANLFVVQVGDARRAGAEVGGLTFYYLDRVLLSPMSRLLFWQPLANTLVTAVCAMAASLTIGSVLAWLLFRTDMWGRRWFSTALIVPFMLPSWTFALAWTTLFKNRTIGGQPGWAEAAGFSPPDWLSYGRVPIILILTITYIPMVILLVGNALRRLDAQLEDCARILGAGAGTVAWQVVLPLIRPALISASVLIFADAIGEFAVPYVLGLPVQYDVLSTSLYRAISSRQTGAASVLAGAIMLIGVMSICIDLYLMREARRFVTIGGKGAMDRVRALGRGRYLATGVAGGFFAVGVVVPLGVLALSTITHMPGRLDWGNFTLDYWIGRDLGTIALRDGVLLSADLWAAAWNSLRIVGLAALASGVLGLLVGYVVTRTEWRALSVFLRQIAFMPYLVPGIAFAAAYLSLFAVQRGPIPALYGTPWILMLALIADQMPFASRSGIAAMTQLGREPEEAARIAGAGWWRRMVSIVAPIQKGALVAGVLMPFVAGIKSVSLFVILAVPATDVLATYSLRLVDYNYTQAANAVVLIIALIAWGGTWAVQRLTRTGLGDGIGG
ncbi:ABC transporter permease [Falsirhodobacter xinxiangensis]|uniref:ABC transporter permease n=1 Tax=Falsirhodobacter xinxiangensis TaxID=2530049 RepID=UPI0010AB16E2|nr:iron ABC transporter permease [Rhodobacter xinxiangensis]